MTTTGLLAASNLDFTRPAEDVAALLFWFTTGDRWLYLTSVLVSFAAVFLKGFQHKNVIGNHLRSVFFTSYAMAMFDVAAVTLIVRGGWPIALTSGTGAAFGMIAAILLHDRVFKRGSNEQAP